MGDKLKTSLVLYLLASLTQMLGVHEIICRSWRRGALLFGLNLLRVDETMLTL